MIVKFKKLHPDAVVPVYKTVGAAGADLCIADLCVADDRKEWRLYPGQILTISTGLGLEIPPGFEGQIRPRSGLGSKGITIVNTPGTVDSDFRGPIRIALINVGSKLFDMKVGDRIAQLVIAPVWQVDFQEEETLEETVRDMNGFGSTGV